MALVSPKKDLSTFLLLTTLALAIPEIAMSQNCGCPSNLCCSQFGYCGSGSGYCGAGCREGPCSSSPAPGPAPSADGESCPGKSFYTGEAFLFALNTFPEFGRTGSVDDGKREIAAFLAHVTHETGNFCYVEEISGPAGSSYCDKSTRLLNRAYPCAPGKSYYGRGPLQLAWNFNYGAAGTAIGFDGINFPEIVAQDPVISFRTAMWFWMTNVHSVVNQGFGATIQKINGVLECNGTQPDRVRARIEYYIYYCNVFDVAPGPNLSC